MEQPSLRKLSAVLVLFALTGVLVYVMPVSHAVAKKVPLREAFSGIRDWRNERFFSLGKEITDALNLDDYLYAAYSRGKDEASLYVGYYGSTEKVGAAHDPLVCLLGQGWTITESVRDVLLLKDGEHINCNRMVVERDETKELIVYWFQSYRSTCSSTVSQKIVSFWNKFCSNREDNAFIWISVPVRDSKSSASQTVNDFVESFYPAFIEFVVNS
jgi:EpsI family protein